VSPFATNTADLALVLQVLAGVDPRDSTSLDVAVPDYTPDCVPGRHDEAASLAGTRVGVPEEYFAEGLDPEVESLTRDALDHLRGLGATIVPVALPHTRFAIPTYYLIATAEASANLSRYDGVRFGHRAETTTADLNEMYVATRSEGFGAEVQRRILLGCYCLREGYADEWYVKAQQVRTLIRRDFDAAFEQCDVIASPTSPIPAFELGEKVDDPLAMYLCDTLTTPANLAGVPGLSIPCGFTAQRLPVGLQLLGRPLDEMTPLRIADAYQRATDFHLQRPDAFTPLGSKP
jgi:aspartyl-tRNA(Asn)/glutamyl-tRNA(Gln) amidotransferase subunit A